jgi:hypothetical protein
MNRVAIAVDRTRGRVLGLLGLGLLAAFLLALGGCGDDGGATSGLATQLDPAGGTASQPTPTATPVLDEIRLAVAGGSTGEPLRIEATLHLGDPSSEVAGVQNDITFDPLVRVAARANGRPDCAFDPVTGKNATAFGFQPPGCIPGADCTGLRVVVLSFAETDPIPDGAGLYTCNLEVLPGAEAGRAYPLLCSFSLGSTPEGGALAVACPDVEVTLP